MLLQPTATKTRQTGTTHTDDGYLTFYETNYSRQTSHKTETEHRTKIQRKLERLKRTKTHTGHKHDDKWVKNISSRSLDKTEND